MLDLKELRCAIQTMDRHGPLYRMLRDELTIKGYWRKKPRGNPRAGYAKMKEVTNRSNPNG